MDKCRKRRAMRRTAVLTSTKVPVAPDYPDGPKHTLLRSIQRTKDDSKNRARTRTLARGLRECKKEGGEKPENRRSLRTPRP